MPDRPQDVVIGWSGLEPGMLEAAGLL